MASFAIADVPCICNGIIYEIIPVLSLVVIVQAYAHTPPGANFWLECLAHFGGVIVNLFGDEITCDEAENSDYIYINVEFAHLPLVPLGSGSTMYMYVDVSAASARYKAESVESWYKAHKIDAYAAHIQFPFYNGFEHGLVGRDTIQEMMHTSVEQRHVIGVALAKLDRRLKKIYGRLNNAALLHSR